MIHCGLDLHDSLAGHGFHTEPPQNIQHRSTWPNDSEIGNNVLSLIKVITDKDVLGCVDPHPCLTLSKQS